jgi:ribonuclease T2
MISTLTAVLFSISCLLGYCHHGSAFPTELKSAENSDSNDWDFLVFSQQWPPTACAEWIEVNSTHKCIKPENEASWTIHGIWPSVGNGHNMGPAFCNNSWHFDMKQLQDIMPLLHRYWPNLYMGTPKANLWSHEWIKHGTCAASLPLLGDQLKYFTAGLNLAQEYNLYSILSASNIIPSDSVHYQIKDIEQAIVKGLGVTPFLSCDLAKKDKSLYLQEVRLCVDKQLQLQNCSTNSTVGLQQAEKCPINAQLAYLPMGNMEPERRTDPLKILAVINALIGLTL